MACACVFHSGANNPAGAGEADCPRGEVTLAATLAERVNGEHAATKTVKNARSTVNLFLTTQFVASPTHSSRQKGGNGAEAPAARGQSGPARFAVPTATAAATLAAAGHPRRDPCGHHGPPAAHRRDSLDSQPERRGGRLLRGAGAHPARRQPPPS